jgi:hypothetical protein
VTGADDDAVAAQILRQLGDPDCERVPVHGIVLVACRGDGPGPESIPGATR